MSCSLRKAFLESPANEHYSNVAFEKGSDWEIVKLFVFICSDRFALTVQFYLTPTNKFVGKQVEQPWHGIGFGFSLLKWWTVEQWK